MTVFVELLRGVNVGRHRRVAMTDVRAALAGGGYDDVTTHLQSGNLVFASSAHRSGPLARSIEDALRTALALDVAAFFERALRTPATVRNWSVVTRLADLVAERSADH